ncbi:phosphopyruvate hydratase [Streptomyces mirabilis]|uniref:phosphopyruvate hydratase n=1 Tax=Streptomyces mirabilis TaxID=68239 RepID=UPI00365C04A5
MSSSTEIRDVFAWEALDSRGTPTVAVELTLVGGATGTAIVPSGASTGTHEARELRDGDWRFGGRGVTRAVRNVTGELAAAVCGLNAEDQATVDKAMREADGEPDLARLGANAVLAVSVATARAAATAAREPLYRYVAQGQEPPLLPLPMVNIISGGAHADRAVDVQDFLVVPVGATSFAQALLMAWRVRAATAEAMRQAGFNVALVADEGGLGPALPSNRAALEFLATGIERAGYEPGTDAAIAIDVAATQFYDPAAATYHLAAENRRITAAELVAELAGWCKEFPIVSIEDVLAEDDWTGWSAASQELAGVQLLGDDLFCTNVARVKRGIDGGVANAVLVKPNQVGTLTDARAVVDLAQAAGMATVLSARSGETEDDWLADLAIGWRTGQIKVGSTMRSERTAKWNRLLGIEGRLGSEGLFAATSALAPIRL